MTTSPTGSGSSSETARSTIRASTPRRRKRRTNPSLTSRPTYDVTRPRRYRRYSVPGPQQSSTTDTPGGTSSATARIRAA
jgi:hypothetical protein